MHSAGRLNILMIMTDQERYPLGFPPEVRLPNHDRLAAQGTTFEQCYVTATICSPSRSAIYTGQHVPNTRVTDNVTMPWCSKLSPDIPTIGHMLREADYLTGYVGKWHLGPIPSLDSRDALEAYGFSDYQSAGGDLKGPQSGYRRDGQMAENAAIWLRQHGAESGDRPWFLAVNFMNPHDVMFYEADAELQRGAPMPLLPEPDDPIYQTNWEPDLPPSFSTDDLTAKPSAQTEFERMNTSAFGPMPRHRVDVWQKMLNYYMNCAVDSDRHLGSVLDALEQSGLRENTVVIYTSDHGELAGAHGLRQKGPCTYDENVRVPLIVCHPDVRGGNSSSALISSIDLVPTFLSWAGVTGAERQDRYPALAGYDFSSVLGHPESPGPRQESAGGLLITCDALFTYDADIYPQWLRIRDRGESRQQLRRHIEAIAGERRGFFRAIHNGRYKFARYFSASDPHRPDDLATLLARNDLELYDVVADPDNVHNLANPQRPKYDLELIATMNQQLNRLIATEIGDDAALGSQTYERQLRLVSPDVA